MCVVTRCPESALPVLPALMANFWVEDVLTRSVIYTLFIMISRGLVVRVLTAGLDQHKQHPSHPILYKNRRSATDTSWCSVWYKLPGSSQLWRHAVRVVVVGDTFCWSVVWSPFMRTFYCEHYSRFEVSSYWVWFEVCGRTLYCKPHVVEKTLKSKN